jgi:hypothetical protein
LTKIKARRQIKVCHNSLAYALYFRCVGEGSSSKELMLVTLDPLLGEMKVENYISRTVHNRTIFQIEEMDEAITRGRHVGLRGTSVLELNRVTGRATVTVGDHEPTYYDCEAPRATL